MPQYILALDQGTTSSRAIAFDRSGNITALSQQPLPQHYPQAGWVEHDPLEIWDTQRRAAAEVIARLPEGGVAGIGVTNQRETTILWDKTTGQPVYNAIVWQCRRTAELCEELKRRGLEERIRSATGLLIDAYFSGSKIRWILDNVPGVRRRAERGEVLFGTVESWLIWKLTGRHVTDFANASRTMLFDIHRLCWDEELCGILGVPTAMLPAPVPNSTVYGTVQPGIPGLESLAGTPVCGAAGDQQSALFGQTCFAPGEAKNTYGTGCFTLMNVGGKPVRSRAGLLTSVAWQVDGQTTYALEGSVFNGGSTIQWLRDELGIISSAPEIDALAAELACRNLTDAMLKELEQELQASAEANIKGDTAAIITHDTRFHELIIDAADNEYIAEISHMLVLHIQRIRYHFFHLPTMRRISASQHRGILDALRERDAQRAKTLMREHWLTSMNGSLKDTMESLRQAKASGPDETES